MIIKGLELLLLFASKSLLEVETFLPRAHIQGHVLGRKLVAEKITMSSSTVGACFGFVEQAWPKMTES
jgi:hypothetical protein